MSDYIIRQLDLSTSPGSASLSQKIVLYSGDKGICLRFRFTDNQYIYSTDVTNLVAKVGVVKPNGEIVVFDDTDIRDSYIDIYVNEEFCNEIAEVGNYKLQLHIYDGDNRVSFEPFGFEVRKSLIANIDDRSNEPVVGYGASDASMLNADTLSDDEEIITSADISNGYTPTVWSKGDIITSNSLNKIELNLEDAVRVINEINSDISNMDLSNYITTSQLDLELASYVTNTKLTTTLNGYATLDQLSGAISTRVTTSELTTALNGYVTTSDLNTTLNGYVTTSDLNNSIDSCVTEVELGSRLEDYISSTNVNSIVVVSTPPQDGGEDGVLYIVVPESGE